MYIGDSSLFSWFWSFIKHKLGMEWMRHLLCIFYMSNRNAYVRALGYRKNCKFQIHIYEYNEQIVKIYIKFMLSTYNIHILFQKQTTKFIEILVFLFHKLSPYAHYAYTQSTSLYVNINNIHSFHFMSCLHFNRTS